MAEQRGFFDLDERYAALSAAGDPLVRLAGLIDFEMFRPELDRGLARSDGSRGGRPPLDAVMMFNVWPTPLQEDSDIHHRRKHVRRRGSGHGTVRNIFLTMHGVQSEQTTLKRQGFDHGPSGGNFVALFIHLQMAQDQRIIGGKGAQDIRRLAVVESIDTVP